MRTFFVFTALIFLSITAAAREHVVYQSQDRTGTTEYAVSDEALEETPSWSPETQPVLLPIPSAVAAAKKHVKPGHEPDLVITQIELHPVNTAKGFRWFYFITSYDRADAYGPNPPKRNLTLVLMNGSIVAPRHRH